MHLIWKAWAFFKRDLQTDLSYKLSFAFQLLDVLVAVAAYYFLARVMGKTSLAGYDPFSFILIGMAVNGYMTTSLACYAHAIRGDQPLGTLKMVLSTPTSPLEFIFLTSLYPIARAAFDVGIYLVCGVLLGVKPTSANLLSAIVIFLLSELAFSSIGILSATFTLVFKRGDPLLWLFGGLSWLLGGVFYPIEVLPRALQGAAKLLPVTHALVGMRAAVLQGASLAMIAPQLEALGLFALICLPLSLAAFQWGIRWAKTTGTLSHF